MIKVGIIFGGESVEHEVSIISAIQAMKSLDETKYQVVPIYITKDNEWYTGAFLKDIEIYKDLAMIKRFAKNVILYKRDNEFVLQSKKGLKLVVNTIDIAFPIVHGTNVEDGTLQGYLDTIKIPYVGSDVYGASLGQDKVFMKQIFNESSLPIVDYTWFYDNEFYSDQDDIIKKCEKLGYPLIIKPAKLGSSVGISKANNKDELMNGIVESCKYDNKIAVEKVVENLVEVNCSVLGTPTNMQVSELEEVMSTKEFLSYKDKYMNNGKTSKTSKSSGMAGANRIIPARIDEKLKDRIKEISMTAFRVLGLKGVCRIDFLINIKKNKIYINEVNTIPGSLSFYLWSPLGKNYTELLDDMITIAIKSYQDKIKKIYSFETNILNNFSGLKGTKGFKNKLQ